MATQAGQRSKMLRGGSEMGKVADFHFYFGAVRAGAAAESIWFDRGDDQPKVKAFIYRDGSGLLLTSDMRGQVIRRKADRMDIYHGLAANPQECETQRVPIP